MDVEIATFDSAVRPKCEKFGFDEMLKCIFSFLIYVLVVQFLCLKLSN